MNTLFIKHGCERYSLTARLEGIYDRGLNLIGYEFLSTVFSFKTNSTITPDFFFHCLSIEESCEVIKYQLRYVESRSDDLRSNKLFITINANESFLKAVLSDSLLLDLIHHLADIIRIEVSEKVDATKYRNALEYLSLCCTLWLDDLGCGDYNNQKKISNLFEFIKFDKNNISTILSFDSGRKFLSDIVAELHCEGLKTLAEGVEDEHRLRLLLDCGFDAFQGWYWR